jgi:adenosylmethionine-8-amino-7-oxononanoate aminotransferase
MKPDSNIFYRRLTHPHPVADHGEGVYLWDRDGRRYIDASGGAAVANIGHGVNEVAKAMADQAVKVAYVHGTMFTTEALETHGKRIANILPLDNPRLYYMSSGSEAVETAIKFTRQVQLGRGEADKDSTIARWGSYHGATLGALAATGKPKMRKPFTSLFRDQPHIPPPYCYRCPFDATPATCKLECAQALEEEILRQGAERIGGFLAESIGGATLGAIVPPQGYWTRVAEICEAYGLLLIVDEVMTGMGRTGKWFGIEYYGVQPDIITLGKGVTGGYFPLSITATKEEHVETIRQTQGDFVHGGTYSHHAVGAAAGLAVLDYIEEHQLVKAAAEQGEYLGDRLTEMMGNLPCVGDVRGAGMLWGVEFVKDRKTKEPFPAKLKFYQRVGDLAFERGVVFYPGGGCVDGERGDHVLIAPPFVISKEEIDEVVEVLKGAVMDVWEECRS